MTREEEEESKGERQIQPVSSSLSVLHSLEYPKRFRELDRDEKGEGGDRGDLGDKKESQNGEKAVKASIHTPKQKSVLKIGFLVVQNW